MVNIPSSMRTRSVGDELIGLRKAAGYSGMEFARKLGWENSRLNRIENGKYRTSEVDITQYVTTLGHPKQVLDQLLTMLRQCEDGFVVQPHGIRLSDQLHTLVRHETTARTIHNLELTVVPGLLQTRGYASALMESGRVPADRLPGLVQARLSRQCLFNRPRQPYCTFYIHEFALRLPVGGDRVMNDQLMHLAFMANSHGVSIRVIPTSRGPFTGIGTGAFALLDSIDALQLPVVYTEMPGASLFLDETAVVEAHRVVLKELDRAALDGGQSRSWLVKLASEYDRPGDGHHGDLA
ncbi:helix-turn-helix domain-containing protein [Umezawaea sp. NPDC059074]|uniref:helix-turn-helix domain-containing protein n=1 Tax=Umezawaea sp. NPDC059074 TaxID=3346716 RepID=UPI0036A7B81C